MTTAPKMHVPVVIFGGGAAGLWLLDVLTSRGIDALLLEAADLGSGQTIASQGILHGGLKYSLAGLVTASARAVSDMPQRWRRCMAGDETPDLRGIRLRAEFCYLWQTSTLRSKFAMLGARKGLQVRPVALNDAERPAVLQKCPATVYRLDEQVIEPAALLQVLADRNRPRIWKIDASAGLEIQWSQPGRVELLRLLNPDTGEPIDLQPQQVVLTAGAGNAGLLQQIGIDAGGLTQRRPLHMLIGRGPLPKLNGHCVDGRSTRITVTTTIDSGDRTIWQVGGQVAERGVELSETELIAAGADELRQVLPAIDLAGTEWSTYRVDRAEGGGRGGRRPNDVSIEQYENTIAVWPTKLVLAPRAADRVIELLTRAGRATDTAGSGSIQQYRWPHPRIALPPWELQQQWSVVD